MSLFTLYKKREEGQHVLSHHWATAQSIKYLKTFLMVWGSTGPYSHFTETWETCKGLVTDAHHEVSKLILEKWKCSSLSHVQLFVTPWTVAHQALLFMEFSRRQYGVDCHALLQGIFPTQGSNPGLLHWQEDSLPLSHQGLDLSEFSSMDIIFFSMHPKLSPSWRRLERKCHIHSYGEKIRLSFYGATNIYTALSC